MASQFEIRLRNQAGQYVGFIDRWLEFTVTRTVNAPAVYGLRLDGSDSRCALFAYDAQIEIWRRDEANSIAWYKEAEGFHVNPKWWRDASGLLAFQSTGKGYLDLLARTRVYAFAETAGAQKTGAAETVLKAYVNEQAGPGAGARARTGLTIQADGATGTSNSVYHAWDSLLETCQDIAATGGGDFDIIGTHVGPNGPATFQLRWYLGQRGTDRTATVIFSEALGNMSEATLTISRDQVINYAIVGGQGQGVARDIVVVPDAADIALTPWGRRETFVDGREITKGDTAALTAKGQRTLAENRQQSALTFKPVQTTGCMYGKHYFLGDKVTALYGTTTYTKKVQTVTLTHNRDGLSIEVGMIDAV